MVMKPIAVNLFLRYFIEKGVIIPLLTLLLNLTIKVIRHRYEPSDLLVQIAVLISLMIIFAIGILIVMNSTKEWKIINIVDRGITIKEFSEDKYINDYYTDIDKDKTMNIGIFDRIFNYYVIHLKDKKKIYIDGFIYQKEDIENIFGKMGILIQ